MYTEESVIKRIEVLEDGQIQVQRADRVLKDGVLISETLHRHVIEPDQDITNEDERVQAVAASLWTEAVIAAYIAAKAAREAAQNPE